MSGSDSVKLAESCGNKYFAVTSVIWHAVGMRPSILGVGLFLLAPLVAEFLLGNLPLTALPALVLLAPLYGGGALLIREVVRRTGRGWPSILVLALAYGVLEEGITTMSLFNPDYAGLRLLDNGYIAPLGIGGPWTVFVLGLHTIWSISAPIAVMEVLAGDRRATPWLGRIGLAVTAVLFAIGIVGTTLVGFSTSHFIASSPQLVATVVVVLGLVAVAFAFGRGAPAAEPSAEGSAAPNPWLVAAFALVASSGFKLLPRDGAAWLYVGGVLLLALGTIALVRLWSRQPGWGDAQRLALAGGALATYAWTAFPETPVLPASAMVDLIGNTVFAIGAIVLVGLAGLHVRQSRRASGGAIGVDQAAVQEQVELGVVDRNQGQRVDRLVEVREEPSGQGQRLVLETRREAVVDDEVHAG
jgi:hypothetical protein